MSKKMMWGIGEMRLFATQRLRSHMDYYNHLRWSGDCVLSEFHHVDHAKIIGNIPLPALEGHLTWHISCKPKDPHSEAEQLSTRPWCGHMPCICHMAHPGWFWFGSRWCVHMLLLCMAIGRWTRSIGYPGTVPVEPRMVSMSVWTPDKRFEI